jgi:hypothetical protein
MTRRNTTAGIMLLIAHAIFAGESRGEDTDKLISYGRSVRPLLVRHCYECHGPDGAERKADLRLDQREAALKTTESGVRPIAPQQPEQSDIIHRIRSAGDDQMPPDDRPKLAEPEIKLIEEWIAQGAAWDVHWAFAPIEVSPDDKSMRGAEQSVDAALARDLAAKDRATFPSVPRATLVRRVYLNLIGLPPTIDELERFLDDRRPDAYARLVDRLLASPRYGERWGRHWLDVARYGDSNGGDENHAYPLAHHYRDYVIDAFNRDLPYDEFVAEQLAGDLLPVDPQQDDAWRERSRRVTATGYLAIGMKILAERDPVKKQADLVDEQIDTVGRTFLGLSLGCARCHDHKFDPVPTRDYYALAGIFHSTALGESELESADYQRRLAGHAEQLTELDKRIAALESRLGIDQPGRKIEREAESFDRGNVIIDRESYGKGVGIISDPGGQKNFAEYDVDVVDEGSYLFQLRFAAAASRPGRVLVDGQKVVEPAFQQTTGSWYPDTQRWFNIGSLKLPKGRRVLRLESEPTMSHLDRWRLIRVEEPKVLEQWEQLKGQRDEIAKQKPIADKVMSAKEATARDVAIHVRGSHLEMGEVVARGVVRSWGGNRPSHGTITERQRPGNEPGESSGRLQLARWITAPNTPAGNLAARVIVNRVWHWHFGMGISTTSDDFGVRGETPRYPVLLDYLASELVRDNWSLKRLHREIVLSQVYRESTASSQSSQPHPVWQTTRLDAEVLRDSMLFVADQLDFQVGNSPMTVKSQDPSPQDMAANLAKYRSSRRRSVYLPVVRSNVYGFLTLFDFPNAASPVADRDETTVPTQALWMLNSPVIQQAAEHVADRLLKREKRQSERSGALPSGSWEDSLEWLLLTILARRPNDDETEMFLELWTLSRDAATLDAATLDGDAARREAWSTVIQALLFSNEAIYMP